VLGSIVAEARERAAVLGGDRRRLEARAREMPEGPPLMDALLRPEVAVIAEVKRRSPSKGVIAGSLSAPDQAEAYHRGGAAAISVLTEPRHFGGSPADLEAARGAVPIPLLKKDFHVDEVQIVEARALGASAVLLIARALDPEALPALVRAANAWRVEPLVEIRDEEELGRALAAGARVIGINNRNLETLEIDAATCDRLLPLVPADRVAIAESGVSSRADVERHASAGADAVLVGSSISAASDPAAAVRALASVRRLGRAR
jgi:indole-3-glycerol phosphate synthase